ncbi:MAG: hypothetical protein PF488_04700 [Patescibacteria group bacterium]|jgi:hypothetical protein|nr:hypothetical protein [Patescibacteria group bacterium]
MLEIQKEIIKNGLEYTINKHNLIYKNYGHKCLLRYNQVKTDLSKTAAQDCRGLILEVGTWKVMSLAFRKFFNAEEGHAANLDWDSARVLEKIDGCCDGNTILETTDGQKTIKDICDSKYNGNVKAFDHELQEIVYSKIIGHSIKKNNNDWYEIELEDGTFIKLTGNHKVYLPNLNCYRRVEDLECNEYFLLEKHD